MLGARGSSAPLLGSNGMPSRQWRAAAFAVAGTAAVLAIAVVAVTVGQVKTELVQAAPQYVMAQPQMMAVQPQMMAAQPSGQPVYYMPVAQQQGLAGQAVQAVQAAQPVVYYYVPTQAAAAAPVVMLNGTEGGGNGTDGGADKKEDKFVCSVANIQAMSKEVQTKWDACKADKDYKEPNKEANAPAKRRLLEWVWEPEDGVKPSAKPRHGPAHYQLHLSEADRAYHNIHFMSLNGTGGGGGNGTADGGNKTEESSFSKCVSEAIGDSCEKLTDCEDPVCLNYYNEPDIEALCGMCTMSAGITGFWGCFAQDSEVVVENQGRMAIDAVKVGDNVLAASADGALAFSRVFFIHDHENAAKTVKIAHSRDVMELTHHHMVPVFTEECGDRYCSAAKQVMAKDIVKGDKIYVATADGSRAEEVLSTSRGSSKVRYVLTEDSTIVVNGVVGSVLSTGAGVLESLPFRLIDMVVPGALQSAPIAAALRIILESPMLRSIEAVVNAITFPSFKAVATPRVAVTTSGTF